MIELVAFLGNYGKEYSQNRHNAAWLFAKSLPFAGNLTWQKKYRGQFSSLEYQDLVGLSGNGETKPEKAPKRIFFLMPETYMNLSGTSVRDAASFLKIAPANILVVHDELEIAPGTASFKYSGGLGGHNGLRSMKDCFGTANFWRLRIGIGRPPHDDVSGWVLSNFSREENEIMDAIFPPLGQAFIKALLEGPEKLLPEWNKKKIQVPGQ